MERNKVKSIVFISILTICCSCGSRYISFLELGPVQAIGNNEEMWLFIELERMVYRSDAAIDTPKVIPMGRIQEVVILHRNGLQHRLRIPINNGRTFHPNLSYIFRWSEQFYLYQGESAFYKQSLYKWENDHFDLLPSIESGAFLKRNVYQSQLEKNMTTPDIESKLFDLTRHEGWNHIYSNRSCKNAIFKWNNIDIKINSVDVEKAGKIKLNINAMSDDNSFNVNLEYNKEYKEISRADYKNLRMRDRQQGHKK